jgi:hypothetical protein
VTIAFSDQVTVAVMASPTMYVLSTPADEEIEIPVTDGPVTSEADVVMLPLV